MKLLVLWFLFVLKYSLENHARMKNKDLGLFFLPANIIYYQLLIDGSESIESDPIDFQFRLDL